MHFGLELHEEPHFHSADGSGYAVQPEILRQLIESYEPMPESQLREAFERCFAMKEGRVLQSERLGKAYDAAFALAIVPFAIREAEMTLDLGLHGDDMSDAECITTYLELATLRSEVGATVHDAVAAVQTRRPSLSEPSVRAILQAQERDGKIFSTIDDVHFAATACSARDYVADHVIYLDE